MSVSNRETTIPTGEIIPSAGAPGNERSPRPFFIIWTGQNLSLVGSHAVQFALIWWLTAQTGSATILLTATLLGLAPEIVLGPVIGALIDRWSRKRVMLVADAIIAAASVALAALFAVGTATPAHVLALVFARAMATAFHAPAMTASTSLMVPERLLTRIQGLDQGAEGIRLIVAAPLGALLYAAFPMAGVMAMDVVTALLAIVPLLFISVPQPAPTLTGADRPSVTKEMAAGFRYLRERRGHLALVSISAGINLLLVPAFALLPLLVMERLRGNAADLGWITSAVGFGMLLGGLLLGAWGGFSRRIVTALSGIVALGVAVAAVGLTPPGAFWWMLTAVMSVGVFAPLVNGPIVAILQATIAPEMQGRVFTLLGSLAGATAPVGLLFAAPLAELTGAAAWFLAGGAMCVAMGVVGFFVPSLRRIEEARLLDAASSSSITEMPA